MPVQDVQDVQLAVVLHELHAGRSPLSRLRPRENPRDVSAAFGLGILSAKHSFGFQVGK